MPKKSEVNSKHERQTKPPQARKDVAAEGYHIPEDTRARQLFRVTKAATTPWRWVDLESRANRPQWIAPFTFSAIDIVQAITRSWGFALGIHMAIAPHLTTAKNFSFPHKEKFLSVLNPS